MSAQPIQRVFVSGVSVEFESARRAVARDLRAKKLTVIEEQDFRNEFGPETLLQKLHDEIEKCDVLVAIVGRSSGQEPPEASAVRMATICAGKFHS